MEQENNPLAVQALQTDPRPKDNEGWEDTEDNRDIIIEDKRIVVKTGGATPIMPADNQLLDQGNPAGTGAETPSGVVIELLS